MERETTHHSEVAGLPSHDPPTADHPRSQTVAAAAARGGLNVEGPAFDPKVFIGPAIMFGLFVLVFWDFLHRQARFAIAEQADWGHTLVIPFIAGYFIYRSRHRLFGSGPDATPFRTTWIALVPLIIGMAAYFLFTLGPQAFNHHNLKGAGFGLSLFSLVLLFVGFDAMRWLWFPLTYLIVFGQTISREAMHLVTYKMQDIAAVGSEKMFVILGFDVSRVGNVVTLFYSGEEHPLNIAEACSGMRMLMAFLALGVAMAYTGLDRNWQRVLLVALAAPIAIFVNMLRVVTLGFLSIFDTEFAAGDFHTFVGLVWLVPAFLLFLGAMWAVKKIVIEPENAPQTPSQSQQATEMPPPALFDSRSRLAFVAACAVLLASGVGFRVAVGQLNIYLTKAPVDLREKFPTIPRTLENWQAASQDQQFDASVVETLGTDEYLDRTYVRREPLDSSAATQPSLRGSGRPVNVHLAYYTGMIDAVPHIPDRCFLAGGFVRVGRPEVVDALIDTSSWTLDPGGAVNRASGKPYRMVSFDHRITGRPMTVRLPIGIGESENASGGVIRVRTTEFRPADRPNSRVFAGFFFIANGHVTPYPTEVRALAFDRTDRYAYYCKVQLTMEGGRDFTHEDFARYVGDLLNELLPEIMRCLPDWAEVESRSEVRGQRSTLLTFTTDLRSPTSDF